MSAASSWLSRHAQAAVAALGRLLRRPLGTLLTTVAIAIALALPAGRKIKVVGGRPLHFSGTVCCYQP